MAQSERSFVSADTNITVVNDTALHVHRSVSGDHTLHGARMHNNGVSIRLQQLEPAAHDGAWAEAAKALSKSR